MLMLTKAGGLENVAIITTEESIFDPGAPPFGPSMEDPPSEDIPISAQGTAPSAVAAPAAPDPKPDLPEMSNLLLRITD